MVIAIRQYVKRFPLALRLIANISFPFILILIKGESVVAKMSDWLIRRTLRAHLARKTSVSRLYQLLDHHLPSYRYTNEMAKHTQSLNLPVKASLASAIYHRFSYTERKSIPEMKINPKHQGIKFAKALGLLIPKQFQGPIPFSQIIPIAGTVIKPDDEHSALGVYIVRSLNDIFELNTGRTFHNWIELRKRVDQLFKEQTVRNDVWLVEEYITGANGNIANDLKFNVFYGRIGWISEIIRYPTFLFCHTDVEGNKLDMGLGSNYTTFKGSAPSKQEIALAEKCSLEIPAPFIRIDFLRGMNGNVFGEFTPRLGIIGYMNRQIDQQFGQLYHEAQARLTADLIAGKKFELFNSL